MQILFRPELELQLLDALAHVADDGDGGARISAADWSQAGPLQLQLHADDEITVDTPAALQAVRDKLRATLYGGGSIAAVGIHVVHGVFKNIDIYRTTHDLADHYHIPLTLIPLLDGAVIAEQSALQVFETLPLPVQQTVQRGKAVPPTYVDFQRGVERSFTRIARHPNVRASFRSGVTWVRKALRSQIFFESYVAAFERLALGEEMPSETKVRRAIAGVTQSLASMPITPHEFERTPAWVSEQRPHRLHLNLGAVAVYAYRYGLPLSETLFVILLHETLHELTYRVRGSLEENMETSWKHRIIWEVEKELTERSGGVVNLKGHFNQLKDGGQSPEVIRASGEAKDFWQDGQETIDTLTHIPWEETSW